LTQIEVDPQDPAFAHPTKPIGPLYDQREARELERTRGWRMAPDGSAYRRVVPSPRPRRILELGVIRLLVDQRVTVICAGGGGIPVVQRHDGGLVGVEAVIDKDLAASLLARELEADVLLLLTDVDAVYSGWQGPGARAMRRAGPAALADFEFAPGSMGPKVEAAVEFVQYGGIAAIGRLEEAAAVLAAEAGTRIEQRGEGILWWD
jgi:carbamate kinase